MPWTSISGFVSAFQAAGAPSGPDLRDRAAELAFSTFGQRALELPGLVNLAALSLSLPRLEVHVLSHGAINAVHGTDLHGLPGRAPGLLRHAWILETKRPERERLFGQVASLAGYAIGEHVFLVGLGYPDGFFMARWTPAWGERDLEIPEDESPLIEDRDGHREFAREAARFAVVLGLLLEARGTPLTLAREASGRIEGVAIGPRRPVADWLIRRISISEEYQRASQLRASRGPAAGRDGLLETDVPVRGHVKRQRYGPGRSEVRWIYVDGYEARRWIAPKPLRVLVS
ncbi:MAG: hypothetical protein IT186_09030 [Acidobacteria bacterium]|nr:hypothetical protein [Acidobacteriota bacterium]